MVRHQVVCKRMVITHEAVQDYKRHAYIVFIGYNPDMVIGQYGKPE